jgi:hypothetical protein
MKTITSSSSRSLLRPVSAIAAGAALLIGAGCSGVPDDDASTDVTVTDDLGVSASAALRLCGQIKAHVLATAEADGWIELGGKRHVLAVGAKLRNAALLEAEASVCIDARVDASARIIAGTVWLDKGHGGSSSGGSSSGGSSSGGSSSGGSSGGDADECDDEDGSSSGGSSSGGSSSGGGGGGGGGLDLDLGGTVDLCGKVDAFAAAGAAHDGSLTIGGTNLSLAKGTSLVGHTLLLVGANVCLHATVDVDGKVIAPSHVTLNLGLAASARVCGEVHAFVAATATSSGNLQVCAPALRIKAGQHLDGEAMLALGARVCVDARLDASGQIVGGTVKAH